LLEKPGTPDTQIRDVQKIMQSSALTANKVERLVGEGRIIEDGLEDARPHCKTTKSEKKNSPIPVFSLLPFLNKKN
jgi:hypothetical protein